MKSKILIRASFACAIWVASGLITTAYASVTRVKSTMLYAATTGTTPVFQGRSQTIRVTGQFVDLCDNPIRIETTAGALAFTVQKGATQGGDGSWVEFSINNPGQSGRFQARLKSGLANDLVQIEIVPFTSISDVQVLTTAGGIAYENAFAKDTDFMLKVTGTGLDKVVYKAPFNITVSNQTGAGSTATVKNVIIQGTAKSDKTEVLRAQFRIGSTNVAINGIVNVLEFGNKPFFRIYSDANLIVSQSVTGIYNRLQRSPCGLVANGGNSVIENPTRCAGVFALATPTPAVPLVDKVVTFPPVVFTIINDSYAPIFTPVTIQVKFGINVLATFTAPRLIAKQAFTVTYNRPEQRKMLARHLNCPDCYEYLTAPFNWADPGYTVVVDAPSVIPESNENDNSRTFLGTQTLP